MFDQDAFEALIRRVVREELGRPENPKKMIQRLEDSDDWSKEYIDSHGDRWRSYDSYWQYLRGDGTWSKLFEAYEIGSHVGPFYEA